MKECIILMADIIDSRKADQTRLIAQFQQLTKTINSQFKSTLLSPLTITLGDEFQGLLETTEDALAIIWALEETIIHHNWDFKMRYVLVEGLIETAINKEIAYGMMGDGLTRARQYLTEIKKEDNRFFFWLKESQKKLALNDLFLAVQDVLDDWSTKDHYLVDAFLKEENYRRVAESLEKEPSLMWKRRKSLRINTYLALKRTANYIAHA